MTSPKRVLVTGATGFIASHAIQQLLETTPFFVRGTVRSLRQSDKFAHLTSLPHADTRLELVEADLLNADTWTSAMRDCDAVFHIASPYSLAVQDPFKDLVEPAELGTEHVLLAAIAETSVTDIVLTSSMAAITDAPVPGKVFTESDWNTLSSLDRNAYYYSKVRGEQKAWELVKNVPGKRLVVLNPFAVIGPSLTKAINPSVSILVDPFIGNLPLMANVSMGLVDVRDVAHAHILALTNLEVQGRHILCDKVLTMQEIMQSLRSIYTRAKNLPTYTAPNWIVKLSSYFQKPGVGQYIRVNVGQGKYEVDNTKSTRELGLVYRPLEESMRETIDNAIEWGFIDRGHIS
ncbi:Aste57867_8599 [Aphanomyces stellatus]|uniref:Aste57867_8599 protein n=1 Tax=Aphanomyces stellatus TaxID=120398 RepID=A0A485KKW5_9STRA|nr:hypothetical protein As57867_008567 [Aphanomyces stellatus]VFT85485.1 Aste57867_8599 [Aphanomyces stellatus]